MVAITMVRYMSASFGKLSFFCRCLFVEHSSH
jgi:hypothetical protein